MGSPVMISICASACVAWARMFEPRSATAEAASVEAFRKERREVEEDFSDMRKRSPVETKQYRATSKTRKSLVQSAYIIAEVDTPRLSPRPRLPPDGSAP